MLYSGYYIQMQQRINIILFEMNFTLKNISTLKQYTEFENLYFTTIYYYNLSPV